MTLKNWYVKTDNAKFYVEKISKYLHIQEEILFFDEDEELKLYIPELEMQYFFECSENKYRLLDTDLKRGVIHI